MDVDEELYDDFENSPSPAPVKSKAAAKKAVAPLGASNAANVQAGGAKAIEEIYQKKSQLEHILLRPDTYIGSTEKQQEKLWVHDGQRMQLQTVAFVPGLYKIFDEILVNAADNKVRDASMDTVKVQIDVANNSIQVWNNGNGIPVEIHKEEKVYVPELIFGHLLTSSNYDDKEKKITGGRNGYGAKLANIFSTEFIIETCDGQRQRRYRQVFRNNMSIKEEPKITSCKPGDNWTCVTFKPDLAKFGMEVLEEDTVMLMRKRVYDLAGILGKTCKVYLNGERLSIKSFQEYVDLYLGPKEAGAPRIYERVSDRWEVCVSPTDGQFQQVSFVNSICTIKGGTHVNYVLDQVTKHLAEKINKKNKNANVKAFMVKNHVWLFINCQIENPAFDSQTKETLTLRASSFGSKCELPQLFIDRIAKCGIVDSILQFATFKNNKELKKSDGAKKLRVAGIPKLDDANDAGGRNSHMCTLILTEGDSAKALAISGLSVVGRDKFGVFPLRGKLLNVREASAAQISGNAEIQNIKQILGLQHGKVYEDVKSLRYGHLMIMTDQDHDGSHIKGLIMNFFHSFYPSLLKVPGFLQEFITPIVKASKGKQRMVFYTMPEYEAWKESLGGTTAGWSVKYYKGLGTSTREEAREYFAAIDSHRKQFVYAGAEDDTAIEMAFSKKKVDDRKEWLSSFVPGTFLDNSSSEITYTDFINRELILFSRADLERSIPCMVDGLKPGQRKILFSCFKRNLKTDIKVAQLAGYVSEHSAYHHGEQSLASTIIGLAQDFVGSNNINLLVPSGQFGTRLQGGKDAASPRYIYTRMAPLTRHLFNEADDQLLNYLNEEGQSIEPEWYMPILPMVLVNGAEGIGTGWSTSIPNYNPRDIVANIKKLMAGEEQVTMQPWYRGFKGSIVEVPNRSGAKSYLCSGTWTQKGETTLEITELPVRKWTQDYKEFLEGLVRPEGKDETPVLAEYKEHHTDVTVHFIVEVLPEKIGELQSSGIDSKLKLSTKFSTSNMMLFDKDGIIKHYNSAEDIISEFYGLRLEYYEKRRRALLKAAESELLRLSNRVRFIMAVINGTLKVSNRRKAEIEADLTAQGFDRMPNNSKGKGKAGAAAAAADEDGEEEGSATGASFNYLLSMPIWSLTWEKVQALQEEAQQQAAVVAHLASTSAQSMWTDDLDNFLEAFETWEAEEEAAAQQLVRQQAGVGRGKGAKGKAKVTAAAKGGKAKKKKGSDSEDEEDEWSDEDDDFDEDYEEKPKPAARKASAPKPAPAAAAPKPVAAPKPAAAPKAAAAPKPSTSGTSSASAAAPASQMAASTSTMPQASSAAPAPSEPLSLAARLAGRFQKLSVAQPTSSNGSVAAPAPVAAAPAAASKSVVVLDDDEEAGTAPAPAPAPLLPKTTKAAAKPKAPAAKPPLGKAVSAAAEAAPPPAKRKPAATGKAAGAAAASKGRKKKVVSDSEEELSDSDVESSEDEDVYELDAPSPAIAPKGKKSKVGPSPLHMKAMSKTAGGVTGKPAAASKTAAPAVVLAPAAAEAPAAEARPQRARRQVQNVSYIEIKDSDEEDEDVESEGDSGSDFSASEEDDE